MTTAAIGSPPGVPSDSSRIKASQWCLDPEGFIPFDLVAAELADAIDGESFFDFGTGLLKWRRSRQDPEGYVSNGCHRCDTILGSWHLGESLARYRAQGGPYERLMMMFSVQLPESLLRWIMGQQGGRW